MINRLLVRLFETYCKIVLHTYAPVRVSGKENLPEEPYLIYSNHNSHLDYIILSVFSSLGFRKTCVLVAKDYWYDNRIRRWFANVFFNAIPVDRSMLFRPESIEEIITECRKKTGESGINRSLIIFPEGKRSRDGKLQNFKTGPAAIASELNLTIVPAYISGSHHVWPKGQPFMKPGKINLVFGEAMRLGSANYKSKSGLSAIKTDTETLHRKVMEMKSVFESEGNISV